MCTVSYIAHKEGYILTFSRDENPQRLAMPPQKYDVSNLNVFSPVDALSGGTWLLTSENGYTLCLLNGAYVAHVKAQSYRHSRGKIPIDFLKHANIDEFIDQYDLTDIEPFTLLVIKENDMISFHTLVWDGTRLTKKEMDSRENHIFSSSTLYDEATKQLRQVWLDDFLSSKPRIDMDKMIDFHEYTKKEDLYNGMVIKRSDTLNTVSICSIDYNKDRTKIVYKDLVKNKSYKYRILRSCGWETLSI